MIAYRKSKQGQFKTDKQGTVCVAGVGGAGCNVLDRMALEGMPNADLVAVNCDVRALQNSMCPRHLQLGAQLTRGLGTGGDPDLGREAAASSEQELRELFDKRDMVFLCAGLGGGTGSGATPHLVRTARDCGAFVVVFATMPFSFEGRRRLRQAADALEELRRHADVLIVFENDRMGELALNKQGIQQAFAAADTVISQSIRSIHTLVRQPGLIQIGMDDLMSALRNEDARCLFGYGDAKGENRAHEALKRALKSPLLHQTDLLEKTATILVHIAGGEDITLFEVELLMRELEKQVPEDAHILFGTAIDPKLGDLLSVSLISSISAKPAVEEPEQETAEAKATPDTDADAGEPSVNSSEGEAPASDSPPAAQADDPQPQAADTAKPDDRKSAASAADVEAADTETADAGPEPAAPAATAAPATGSAEPAARAETMDLLGFDDLPPPAESAAPATTKPAGDQGRPTASSGPANSAPAAPLEAGIDAGTKATPQPVPGSAADPAAGPVAVATPPFVSIKPANHSAPVPVNSFAGVAATSGGQASTRTFNPTPAPARTASHVPLGRRLPNFGSPLTQAAPAVPREPKESLLKSLANGSVPMERKATGPLAAPPTQATPPAGKAGASVPPPLDSGAAAHPGPLFDDPAADDEPMVNPIAAAMQQARRETDQTAAPAAEAPTPPAAEAAPAPAPTMPAVDHDDHRDFGRPEAERATIEPFPQPEAEPPRPPAKPNAKAATRKTSAQEQPMLDLEPAIKGRFERSEPNIVDGEDLDVPAFLRRGR